MTIRISDMGGGIPFHKLNTIFQYFYTTVPYSAPTYTYSGNFGSPLHGLGVGKKFQFSNQQKGSKSVDCMLK